MRWWEPMEVALHRNGLLVAAIAGAVCGAVGVFVVLRGMSYIGHGLSHAVFGGAAAATVLNVNYFLGAGVWAVASGLAIGRVTRRRVLGADVAIGVVTTVSLAAGTVLFHEFEHDHHGLDTALFGDVMSVTRTDVIAVAAVAVVVALVMIGGYRRLLFATFDPEVAAVSGVRTDRHDAALMILISLTVVVTMRVIGALLISALLVIPPATARLMTRSFARMLKLAPVIGAVTSTIGMSISFAVDTPAGATIIVVNAVVFAAAYSVSGASARRAVAGFDHHGPGIGRRDGRRS